MSPIRSLLALLLSTAFVLPAAAFKLTPIEAEFAPGQMAVQTFKLDNVGGVAPVAIEITVHARGMARDGGDLLEPAADDFAVFPDQIVLQPGETQSVRVQWTGSEPPQVERAYRLVAEQLPIDLGTGPNSRSGLKLMVKYLAALYVRPVDPAARLSASIATAVDTGEAGRELLLTIRNDGNAHALLQAPMVLLQAGGQTIPISPQQRESLHGKNILAGVEREFRLPWPAPLPSADLAVQLQAAEAGQ